MKNKLLLVCSILLLSVSLSSCYVDGPGFGYAYYHPAPRYYSHPRYAPHESWGGRHRGWERHGGHGADRPARAHNGYRN